MTWDDEARIIGRVKRSASPGTKRLRAYVIVASENEAQIARLVLESLEAEYVVKVVDYLHLGPTELPGYPNLAKVLNGAKRVFALTPPIQRALAHVSKRNDILILGDGRKPSRCRATKPDCKDGPLQIVMVGSLAYPRGLAALEKFCAGLENLGLKYCLNYIGSPAMRDRLGARFPVNYRGVLSDTERDSVLTTMHLGYLPGPDGDPATDCLAHFSFPSRLADYFWHGLPVIGPLFKDSATAQMLSDLAGKGVWFDDNSEELVAVAKKLMQHPADWVSASDRIYQFAQKNFSIECCTQTILEAFEN
jgi:hypothetical protein